MKKRIIYFATLLFAIIFIYVGYNSFNNFNTDTSGVESNIVKARIVNVSSIEETDSGYGSTLTEIVFTARITSGELKGRIVMGVQNLDDVRVIQDHPVSNGDNILLVQNEGHVQSTIDWHFISYNRVNPLVMLCLLFAALIVFIGRAKGVSTLLSLIITCLIIFLVYIPSILSGVNVYFSSIVVGIVMIFITLILINGIDKKTVCAILGNVGGVFIAASLAFYMNSIMNMTGFIDENYAFLSLLNPDQPLDLVAIIWGGMLIGSLGAIMDVAMSVASSMHELSEHMSDKTFRKLFTSGMNIGKDAIGTMTNTLILAYIGGSLSLVLLLIVHTQNTYYLFSMEMIAFEIVKSITGSIGILFAVPMTAAICAYVYTKTES